jgi:hypothetical protein
MRKVYSLDRIQPSKLYFYPAAWLFTDQDYGYAEFFATIDTVIVGREQMLSFGEYPYQGTGMIPK